MHILLLEMEINRLNTVNVSLVVCILLTCFCVRSLADVCRKIDDCSCIKDNGKVISLRKIDGGCQGPAFKGIPTYFPSGTPFVFDWNPCTKFSEGSDCKDMLMCQKSNSTATETHPCADTVSSFQVESDGSTTIIYEVHTDSMGYKRAVTINLKCDESKFPGETSGVTEDYTPMSSIYSMTFRSKCACDDGCIPADEDDVVF